MIKMLGYVIQNQKGEFLVRFHDLGYGGYGAIWSPFASFARVYSSRNEAKNISSKLSTRLGIFEFYEDEKNFYASRVA
jgi:hypothetical protein